jgi:hypothetical protein
MISLRILMFCLYKKNIVGENDRRWDSGSTDRISATVAEINLASAAKFQFVSSSLKVLLSIFITQSIADDNMGLLNPQSLKLFLEGCNKFLVYLFYVKHTDDTVSTHAASADLPSQHLANIATI